jgi:hypothetical protein
LHRAAHAALTDSSYHEIGTMQTPTLRRALLPLLKIGAEVGQASGGEALSTVNSFTNGGANAARRFASAGIRVSF